MLWDIIFDFFVHYIFGGIDSQNNVYPATLGGFFYNGESRYQSISTSNPLKFNNWFLDINIYWCTGNYFSFIATIISIVVIFILCCLLVKKIYNICAHIIG